MSTHLSTIYQLSTFLRVTKPDGPSIWFRQRRELIWLKKWSTVDNTVDNHARPRGRVALVQAALIDGETAMLNGSGGQLRACAADVWAEVRPLVRVGWQRRCCAVVVAWQW